MATSKKTAKRSGFEAPAIGKGIKLNRGTTLKVGKDGTITFEKKGKKTTKKK